MFHGNRLRVWSRHHSRSWHDGYNNTAAVANLHHVARAAVVVAIGLRKASERETSSGLALVEHDMIAQYASPFAEFLPFATVNRKAQNIDVETAIGRLLKQLSLYRFFSYLHPRLFLFPIVIRMVF